MFTYLNITWKLESKLINPTCTQVWNAVLSTEHAQYDDMGFGANVFEKYNVSIFTVPKLISSSSPL